MREGWEIKQVGEIADITDYVANGSFATLRENVSYLDKIGYAILVRLADYTNNFDESKFVYIDEHAYNFLAKSKLFGGEIIMSNVGSIGKLFICPDLGMPMSLAPNSIVIKTKYNHFYYYLFQSNYFQVELKSISSQTALPKFNKTSLKKINIPIPPLEEQERIVEELDCLSGVIEKKKQQLKELDVLAQSIFYEMFGNPVENDRGWEVKKFKDCYKLTSGKNLTAKQIVDGDYPVYGGNGIVGYHNDYNLDGDNIIIGRVGALCGNVRNVLGKSFITDNAFILTKLEAGINVFVLYLLRIHDLRQYARDALQPVISNAGFQNIEIILPPFSLQQQFAEKIEKIEKQKELIRKSIEEVEMLFNSRMEYYFN